MNFRTFITESELVHEKLTHLTHAEDLPLVAGEKGYHHAMGALKSVGGQLEGKFHPSKVTIKYDGSPAVVFGHDPISKKFFVASKSAFNKAPKINYSVDDIRKNHKDAPGLQEKLIASLEHLKKIAPQHGVYQGDLMYTEDDKHETKDHINFTPNTIMYSLPKKSEHGKKAKEAKLGIAIHTQYAGPTLEKMKAHGDVSHAAFKEHKDVHVLPHEVNLSDAIQTGKDVTAYEHNIKMAEKTHNQMHVDALKHVSAHEGTMSTYINQAVREGHKPSLPGYRLHLLDKMRKAVEGVKTAAAKQKHHDAWQSTLRDTDNHAKHFEDFFKLHRHLQAAKNALVNQLKPTTHGIEHSIGGKETSPEGFVVHHEGYPVKFVNREEFSRANFERSKNR